MRFLTILPVLFLFTLSFFGAPAIAEEYPALSQAAPMAGEIAAEAIQVQARLETLLDTAALADQFVDAAASFRDLQVRVQTYGDPGSWHIDRLLDTRSQLVRGRQKLQALAQRLTRRQEEVEAIRLDWGERQQCCN